jgi:hypothetical protein
MMRRSQINFIWCRWKLDLQLRRDYEKMERDRMFFGESPTLEEILESLKELEARINDAVLHGIEAQHQQNA